MHKFHKGYKRFCSGKGVSHRLRPLIARVYINIHLPQYCLPDLRDAMIALFSFLCEPQNRTTANCLAVDLFFAISDHWEVRWENLPGEYQDILEDVGGALHDTISFPDIAKNFNSTPEQLLERAKKLKV